MLLLLKKYPDIRKRGFAAMYDLVTAGQEPKLAPYRLETAGRATGDVLEIGGGTGANLSYYKKDTRLTVLEPNTHMAKRLSLKANAIGRDISIVTEMEEGLPFPDASFDSVVSTLVLCSVPNHNEAIRDIRRVLRPNGVFYFLEHVVSSDPKTHKMQDILNGPWGLVADGCNLNRDIESAVRSAGFSNVEIRAFDMPIGLSLSSPHVVGVAWG